MPILFNSLLTQAGVALTEVRLLRHKDGRADKGRSPYDLWRRQRPQFDLYQSIQDLANHGKLYAPYWAVFLGAPNGQTLFAGLYQVRFQGPLQQDVPAPSRQGAVNEAGRWNVYDLTPSSLLEEYIGKLLIDWGAAPLAWIQYADRNDKVVVELRREFQEPEFPGLLSFMKPLSEIDDLPPAWAEALKSSKGVYLLSCPRTREQYVGSAHGEEGFWGRWQHYVRTGHGGNEVLKMREPSDYQVSILEVAGSASTTETILQMESRWRRKLHSRATALPGIS